jgi:uncharacterized protein YndB with AHSA1/START domain
MTTSGLNLKILSDLEITMSREFNAPRRLVFEAHSKCEHMVQWFGPRIYDIECEMDFRTGGLYRFIHRGPDGEHAFRGQYLEIVEPERIVYTFEYEGMPGHISTDTVTFEERDGKTTIYTVTKFASLEDRDGMLQSGMESGALESYDRLDELLGRLS